MCQAAMWCNNFFWYTVVLWGSWYNLFCTSGDFYPFLSLGGYNYLFSLSPEYNMFLGLAVSMAVKPTTHLHFLAVMDIQPMSSDRRLTDWVIWARRFIWAGLALSLTGLLGLISFVILYLPHTDSPLPVFSRYLRAVWPSQMRSK